MVCVMLDEDVPQFLLGEVKLGVEVRGCRLYRLIQLSSALPVLTCACDPFQPTPEKPTHCSPVCAMFLKTAMFLCIPGE